MLTPRAVIIMTIMAMIIIALTMIDLNPRELFLFVMGGISGVVLYHLLTIEE